MFLGRKVRSLQIQFRWILNLDKCLVQGAALNQNLETKDGIQFLGQKENRRQKSPAKGSFYLLTGVGLISVI